MNIKNKVKSYFTGNKEALSVYLFGSTAAGKSNKFSDVDIAVLFDRNLPQRQYTEKRLFFINELSRILDRDIDIVILNEASSFLKFQIIKSGIRIYERPNRTGHAFEAQAIVEYFDFLPIRKRLEAALINSIKGA